MDPLHPIVPRPPEVPPLAPAVGVRKTARDGNRAGGQRRQDQRRSGEDERSEPEGWEPADDDDEDEGRPHIDVTA